MKEEMNRNECLIIIPTYNEKGNIKGLIDKISATGVEADIIVVDDNSPDGTAEEVMKIADSLESGKHLFLIKRVGERGLGTAYTAGLKYGLSHNYDVLVTMDADHSHNPIHLPAMLAALNEHDIVIGSRYIRDGGTINWRIRRILLSWLANKFARFILRLKGNDLTSGYRAYRAEIISKITLDKVRSEGYSYLVEILYRACKHHARVREIPIIFFDRTMGKSKISKREIYKGALTLLRLRFGYRSDAF